MASRKLKDLRPGMRLAAIATKADFDRQAPPGTTLLIYCTHRPPEEQAILFRQGRSLRSILYKARQLEVVWDRPDLADILRNAPPQMSPDVVTWAGPGQSTHQYRVAIDAVPICAGRLLWKRADLYNLYGECAEANGLEWAQRWSKKKREKPHTQLRGFDWRLHIHDLEI